MENKFNRVNHLTQMFILNMLANKNHSYLVKGKGYLYSNMEKIGKYLKDKDWLKNLIGNWEVVWGPALANSFVEKKNGTKYWLSDNSMYMAKAEGKEEYFVGVAGTNQISAKGWFVEDLNVEKTQTWPSPFLDLKLRTKAKISKGTHEGLYLLWDMKPQKSNERLIDFILSNLKGKKASIFVGGHSLGGCLSPVLATAIADKLAEDPNGAYSQISITAYPTAGPTPGDEAFANHLTKMISYEAVVNNNDVIPQAWDFTHFPQLLRNYSNFKVGGAKINPEQTILRNFIGWAKDKPGNNKYVRDPKKASKPFEVHRFTAPNQKNKVREWKINTMAQVVLNLPKLRENLEWINEKKELGKPEAKNFLCFFMEMGGQHVEAYGKATSAGIKLPEGAQKLLGELVETKTVVNKCEKIHILYDLMLRFTHEVAVWVSSKNEANMDLPIHYEDPRSQEEIMEEIYRAFHDTNLTWSQILNIFHDLFLSFGL